MSTLTLSIIALVVFVVGAVALFNLWQARGSRELRRDGLQGRQRDSRHRYESLKAPAAKGEGRAPAERPGSHRWQPGAEQNAWARQRREPTMVADDDSAATRLPSGTAGDRRHAGAPVEQDADTGWPAGSYMTADDGLAAERGRADEAEQGRREAARQAEARAGGSAGFAGADFAGADGFGGTGSDRWDLPDPDEELGPPEFETPPFDPESIGPLNPEGPRLDLSDAPGRPPGFEQTRPFAEGGAEDATGPSATAARPAPVSIRAPERAAIGEGNGGHDDGPADHAGADAETDDDVTDAVRPSVYVPAEIDHVVTLIPRAPVNAERLIALTSSLRHVGSKSVRIEIDNGQGRWVPLQSGAMVGCLRCSVLLANRQGPLNAIELSDFTGAMESLAGQIGARFIPPDMNQVLRQARHLDAVAAKLDTQVDLGVEASAPVTSHKLASVARQLDLADRGGGRFACFADGGELLYTLMPGETSDLLAFVLDVPRTPEEYDPWRSMVACAASCAQLVGGRMVDGAGRGMSVSMIESVGQQLRKRYQELSKVGLKAGSPAALRLFN